MNGNRIYQFMCIHVHSRLKNWGGCPMHAMCVRIVLAHATNFLRLGFSLYKRPAVFSP